MLAHMSCLVTFFQVRDHTFKCSHSRIIPRAHDIHGYGARNGLGLMLRPFGLRDGLASLKGPLRSPRWPRLIAARPLLPNWPRQRTNQLQCESSGMQSSVTVRPRERFCIQFCTMRWSLHGLRNIMARLVEAFLIVLKGHDEHL